MPSPIVALAGATIGSSVIGSSAAKNAASTSANTQLNMYEQTKDVLSPYVGAGNQATQALLGLSGLSGAEAQQAAVSGIQQGSQYQTALSEGVNAMQQSAAATGGLRGGNYQQAMSQYAPNLLNQMIQQQYSNLSGLASMGQNAAAGAGNAAMQTGQNVGATQAAGITGSANALQSGIGNLSSLYGAYTSNPAMFGATPATTTPTNFTGSSAAIW